MLDRKADYRATCDAFRWAIPEFYNMGVDVCDKWAVDEPDRVAIHEISEKDLHRDLTYGDMRILSNQLANALSRFGISGLDDFEGSKGDLPVRAKAVGDRVGILLPQCLETAISHVALWKLGCVSLPLFTLFGEDALLHRLGDSGAKAVITNAQGAEKLAAFRDRLPVLEHVFVIDGPCQDCIDFHATIADESPLFEPVRTLADDAALLIYTSGTTGNPKGALHGHRVLLGHLPGVEMHHEFLPQPGDRMWTPADWAWIGGLMNVLMPSLHHGVPVVACRIAKFTGEWALRFIKEQGIRNAFLPPTALKLMRQVPDAGQFGVKMRTVGSGGESLGTELLDWGRDALGVTINEFYGQTECNLVVSSCAALDVHKPGVMGRAAPGHVVEIVNELTGELLPAGEQGAIAIKAPDPVMFLRYWNRPDATRDKFVEGKAGSWLLTGDQGIMDEWGNIQFVGRDDDVIGSAGYRIGPTEVEDCLLRHPAVEMAGVVGKPDPVRNSVVAAYIKLAEGFEPSGDLANEIADFVKHRLAAHEYPRAVRFLDDMPMTTTGKIIRARLREMARSEAEVEADPSDQER